MLIFFLNNTLPYLFRINLTFSLILSIFSLLILVLGTKVLKIYQKLELTHFIKKKKFKISIN